MQHKCFSSVCVLVKDQAVCVLLYVFGVWAFCRPVLDLFVYTQVGFTRAVWGFSVWSCWFLSKHDCWVQSRNWCTSGWGLVCARVFWEMGDGSEIYYLKAEWKYYVRMSGCKPVCCESAVSVTGHWNRREWWDFPWFGLQL